MIDGVFREKSNGYNIILMICGIIMIGFFIFIKLVDNEAGNSIFVLLAFGLVEIIAATFGFLFNYKAFLTIDGTRIRGKYHWFGKVDCDISEVDFSVYQINTLVIQLKSGKRHAISGVMNSEHLCALILKQLPFERKATRDDIRAKTDEAKAARKTNIYICIGMLVMAFVMIFVAVFFTDAKENFSEFTAKDWTIFSIAGSCFVLALVMAFVYAGKAGRYVAPIKHLEYVFRRTVAETQPIAHSGYKSVYINADCTFRWVIYTDRLAVQPFIPAINEFYHTDYVPDDEYLDEEFAEDIAHIESKLSSFIDITDRLSPVWFR